MVVQPSSRCYETILSFLTIFILIIQNGSTNAWDSIDPILHCSGVHPQQSMDLEKTLGKWFAVETVQHREDSKYQKGRVVVDACPSIYLTRTGTNQIKLLWDERAGKLEYNFHIKDLERPGFWLSYGAQNGSLLKWPYSQFAGTVEITKAVGTHMVLTFCTPETELYSVVVSRNKQLSKAELRGVNRMLEHRGLQRFAVRESCKDAAIQFLPNFIFLILSVMIIIFAS